MAGAQPVDQGILTADGGNISIYTQQDVTVGTSRIFTLRGGNIIIWSNAGNIAAGEAAKTVQSAPPTRVLIDPQSGDVQTDLAGLGTGGGIGVLAAVQGVAPGNVDLIAPRGFIDAGDAGIRSTGNLNLAAVQVLNASNIQPAAPPQASPPSLSPPPTSEPSPPPVPPPAPPPLPPPSRPSSTASSSDQNGADSIITVSVIGYGGGESDDSM